ncbi:MAG TPA: hypothetical protein VK897_02365 [Anaerolineales bacterium]|nr:hypothetical protein [Anaerolineales bacterium]
MPLFDLFKKSPKKEPVQTPPRGSITPPARGESLMSPEMQKKRYDAAMDFVQALQEKTPLMGGRPHAGTVLAVAARLAGSSLHRSLHYKNDIAPGTVVLSDQVNEAWPQLLNMFAFYCKQNGLDVMSKPLVTVFPEQNKPLMGVEEVLSEYQDQYHAIMKKHGLDYVEGARAGMIVCSIVFEYHCKKVRDIDPFVATGIIAMGIVEGAKTAPPPSKPATREFASASKSNPENSQFFDLILSIAQNSIDGSGARLVLGEGMTSMQESLSHGGKYILVHPEVLKQLKDNNIDAFLIYAAAIRTEVAAGIPRIDFIGGNVDELLKAWSGKTEDQTPMHVRQVQWLKNNAAGFGYQQDGNSWVLKQ